jgi:hypothetical protein
MNMPSFTIADCPPSLPATPIDERTAGGRLSLTVRNASDRLQTARITVVSADADPAWFSIEGAPATRSNLLERDFEPNATQTITVSVHAPRAADARTYTFRVNVTAEERPDDDHTDGPAVSLAVPALAQAAPPPPPCRWCKPAIAAGIVLAIAVGAWWVLTRAPDVPDGLIGETRDAAIARLIDAGFEEGDVSVEDNGPPIGQPPGTVARISTAGGGRRVTLVLDPGVMVEAPQGSPIEETVARLIRDGLNPEVARIGAQNVAFFRVETVSPHHGEIVAKDTPVQLTTFVPQSQPTPPTLCERIRCSDIILDPSRLPPRFEQPVLAPRNRVLQGVEGVSPNLQINEAIINRGGQN